MIVIAAALLAIPFVFVLCAGVSLLVSPSRVDTVAAALSPDQRFVATVTVERHSGNIGTDFSTKGQVWDFRELARLGGPSSRIFLASRSGIKARVTWQDSRTLVVEYQDRNVYVADDKPWHGIDFILRKMNQ
ncbi:MAG: hypothetical protein HY675_07495 [Chloroflexi bacterium]|nr:hypothetical protein [Chloroflexota bacterium]